MAQDDTPAPRRIVLRGRPEGDCVVIEVEDNGPGMSEAVRKRIFEPFFTAGSGDRGTGLGLSVARFIVAEQHHGSIDVESTPGAGSRFIIRLPVGTESPGNTPGFNRSA